MLKDEGEKYAFIFPKPYSGTPDVSLGHYGAHPIVFLALLTCNLGTISKSFYFDLRYLLSS